MHGCHRALVAVPLSIIRTCAELYTITDDSRLITACITPHAGGLQRSRRDVIEQRREFPGDVAAAAVAAKARQLP